jgi:hypothetical protein
VLLKFLLDRSFGFHYLKELNNTVFSVQLTLDFLVCGARMVNETTSWFQKISVRKFLMNWKTLLVIASLSLTTGLTACNSTTEAPKTDSAAPAADAPKGDAMKPADAPKGDAMKPADAPKGDAMKPADAPKGDAMKPADAPKGDAMKPADGAKPGAKPADAPKKP